MAEELLRKAAALKQVCPQAPAAGFCNEVAINEGPQMRPFVVSAICVDLTGAQIHIDDLPGAAVEIAIGAVGYF